MTRRTDVERDQLAVVLAEHLIAELTPEPELPPASSPKFGVIVTISGVPSTNQPPISMDIKAHSTAHGRGRARVGTRKGRRGCRMTQRTC